MVSPPDLFDNRWDQTSRPELCWKTGTFWSVPTWYPPATDCYSRLFQDKTRGVFATQLFSYQTLSGCFSRTKLLTGITLFPSGIRDFLETKRTLWISLLIFWQYHAIVSTLTHPRHSASLAIFLDALWVLGKVHIWFGAVG